MPGESQTNYTPRPYQIEPNLWVKFRALNILEEDIISVLTVLYVEPGSSDTEKSARDIAIESFNPSPTMAAL